MKKLILAISVAILLNSCGQYDRETNECFTNTIRILDKRSQGTKVGKYYELYVYNGVEAKWYDTDSKTFNMYQKNDTLPTLVLRTVRYEVNKK